MPCEHIFSIWGITRKRSPPLHSQHSVILSVKHLRYTKARHIQCDKVIEARLRLVVECLYLVYMKCDKFYGHLTQLYSLLHSLVTILTSGRSFVKEETVFRFYYNESVYSYIPVLRGNGWWRVHGSRVCDERHHWDKLNINKTPTLFCSFLSIAIHYFFIFLEALFSFLVLGKYSHVLATRSERRCFNLHNCSTLLSYSLCTNTNRHYVQLPVFLTLYWSPKVEGMVSLPSSLLTSFLTLNSVNNV